MAIVLENRLTGPVGQQVSNQTLAASAELGTVTVGAPGDWATYSDAVTVYDLPTIRVETGYRRAGTPQMQINLPAGAWTARFYIQLPDLSAEGQGVHGVRWVFRAGNMGLVFHEAGNGNISARIQSTNLNAADINPTFSGTGIPITTQVRAELSSDGTQTVLRLYAGHDTASPYSITWATLPMQTGVSGELTGYRYWRDHFMSYGNTTFSQDVANYQQFLIDLGYPAPQFGADGFYGAEMAAQWDGFAADYGFPELVGTFGPGGHAGAEILAAVDLAIDELNGITSYPPVYVSNLAIADQVQLIGPAPEPDVLVEGDGEPLAVEFDLETAGGPVFHGDGQPLDVEFDLQEQGHAVHYGDGEDLAVEFDFESEGTQVFSGDGEGLGVEFALTTGEGYPVFAGEGALGVEFDFTDGGAYLYFQGDGEPLGVEFDLASSSSLAGDGDPLGVEFDLQSVGGPETFLPDVPMVGLRYRLIAYAPDGEQLGQLPYPLSITFGVPHNDMPSLTLEYLKDAPGAALLSEPCEVAVELAPAASGLFTEYPGCRFINIREKEDLTDRTGVVSYTMPNYGWMTRKIRNIRNEAFNDEGERVFSSATVGEIFHTFLTEAQSRGNIPGMSWSFTETHDSAGRPWARYYNLSFPAGQDLWTTMDALANQGAMDWRFHRRTLQLYVVDTRLNRDKTNDVILRLHRDVTDAPNDSSAEELASRIFVQGEGAYASMTSSGAMQPWGAWEDYITQSGVSDAGTLLTLAQWRMEKTRALRRQMTRGLLFNTTEYLPFVDYLPGDRISAPGVFSQADPLRVRQITLASLDSQGMEGNVILNDRFLERELRRDRQINALTGGASGTPGGGGGRPGEDTRTPKAPTSLLLSTNTYLNEMGEPRGQITATWEVVEEATNNTEMPVDEYQVWVRHAVSGETFRYYTTVPDPDHTAFMSPFDVDEVYEVRVRAIGHNNRPGLWSSVNSIRVEPDAIAPPTPSQQILTSNLSVVNVAWDGLTWDGLRMPPDFDHVRVWMGSDPTVMQRINTLYREGSIVVPGLEYDTPYWFSLTAVDRSGNESDPTTPTSIEVQELVPTDFFGPGSIGYELLAEGAVRDDILADDAVRNRHIAAGEVTGEKIRAYSITADRIAVGNTKNLLADPRLDDDDLFQLRKSLSEAAMGGVWSLIPDINDQANLISLSRANVANGSYEFYYVQNVDAASLSDPTAGIQMDVDLGRVVGRFLLYIEGLTAGTVRVGGYARFLRSDGSITGTEAVIAPVTFSSGVNTHEMISVSGSAIPLSAYSVIFYVSVDLVDTPTSTIVWVRSPFVGTSNGSVLIEDGAVIANKIAANAVTANKIDAGAVNAGHIQADAIQTDQLSANAITSKHTITGATIQTTSSANRGLKITSTGLRGYDLLGNETFSYTSSTGLVRTTGRFQSGVDSGNNVVVDSNLYDGRPAIQLNTGTTHGLQPVMYSLGSGSSGYPAGALVINGRETTINSSGRNTLQLNAGSGAGAALEAEFGTYAGIGMSYEFWALYLRGRMTSGTGRLDYQAIVRSGISAGNSPTVQWTLGWGQAAHNGGRLVVASRYGVNQSFRTITATVINNYQASTVIAGRDMEWSSGAQFRVQVLATWTEESWSSV